MLRRLLNCRFIIIIIIIIIIINIIITKQCRARHTRAGTATVARWRHHCNDRVSKLVRGFWLNLTRTLYQHSPGGVTSPSRHFWPNDLVSLVKFGPKFNGTIHNIFRFNPTVSR